MVPCGPQGRHLYGISPELTVPLPGDYDGDGNVGINDLNLVLFSWDAEEVPPTWVNQIPTGQVGIDQLNGVLFNWARTLPPQVASVPEPHAVCLALLTLTFLPAALRRGRV